MKKKLIPLALTLIMVLCMMPMQAFAAANTPIDSIDLSGLNLGEDFAGKTVAEVKAEISGYSGYAAQNLSFITIEFADSSYNFLAGTDSFVAGNTYIMTLVLKANDGYYFDNEKAVGSYWADYLGTVTPNPMMIMIGVSWDPDGDIESGGLDTTADQMIYLALAYQFEATSHVHEKGTHHDAVAPTCEEGGTVEYWDCAGCDKKLNAEGEEITDIADGDPLGHSFDTANWTTSETEHWHAATCGHTEKKDGVGSHADSDKDHKCDVCGYVMSECVDENKDHVCDFAGCGEKISECVDENKDHVCDFAGCGKTISECADEDGDQLCDVCGKYMGSNPDTGDSSNLALYACLFMFSLIGASVVIRKKSEA